MAMTKENVGMMGGRRLQRHKETGAANTELVATLPASNSRRIMHVTAKYSGVPVQAGVTVELDSGAGAAYDAILYTFTANAQNNAWIPDDLVIGKDDALIVRCPAGGGVLTAAVTVESKLL